MSANTISSSLTFQPSLYGIGDCASDPLFTFIQELEKYELHTHIGGGAAAEDLLAIAQEQGKMDAYGKFVEQQQTLAGRVDYKNCFHFFTPIEEILGVNTPAETDEELSRVRGNIIKCVLSVCRQYAEDNVKYVELRTSLKRIFKGGDFRPYLDAVLEGISHAEARYAIKAYLLLSVRRRTSDPDCQETVNLAIEHMYKKPGGAAADGYERMKVVGLDLSGSSIEGDGKAAIAHLRRGKEAGLPVSVHLGESELETPEQQALEMRELQPERTGHGVNVHDRTILGNTPNEFCPTSAFCTNMHDDEAGHPSLEDLRTGARPVVICCDDLTMSRHLKLSHEIYWVAKQLGWGEKEVAANQQLAKAHRFKNYFSAKF